MPDKEVTLHLDYLEGVLLAQSLVLTALLKQQPVVLASLKDELEQIVSQLDYVPMTSEKKRALTNTLEKITGGMARLRAMNGKQL